MPATPARRRRSFQARCIICGEPFQALTSRHTTDSAECQRERKRRTAATWYASHRQEHIERVMARRK